MNFQDRAAIANAAVTASRCLASGIAQAKLSHPRDECASPFSARTLTRSERRRCDLYIFQSPKLSRRIELIGCVNTALALIIEFDPDIESYVERPRTLSLASGRSIECAFWIRKRNGSERFWMLVSASETINAATPRREHRLAREVIEAAQAAHIAVEFIFEDDVRRQSATLSTWYKLLPYVQTARTLPHREALSRQVLALFDLMQRATVAHLELQLQAFHAADVRAVVFELVHRGDLKLADSNRLSRFSVIARRDDHEPS